MTATVNVLSDVAAERDRQERYKADGRFEFSCADAGLTNVEKLAVLVEEVGEVTREVLTLEGLCEVRDSSGTPAALRAELIQVAAVAVAWAEALT